MNDMDGKCACCGDRTPYTGALPTLCPSCREARKMLEEGSGTFLLPLNNLNPRLFLPDSELIKKGANTDEQIKRPSQSRVGTHLPRWQAY